MSESTEKSESADANENVVDNSTAATHALYDDPEQARIAVKLLVNQGFDSKQIFVMCTDEKRSDAFRSRLMPAGAAQLNSAPTVVGGAGAAVGAAVLGGAGLASGGIAAVAGAAIGAVAGGGVGFLLGAGTYSDDETDRLMERYTDPLKEGLIVVHVRTGDDEEQRTRAEGILLQARGGVV